MQGADVLEAVSQAIATSFPEVPSHDAKVVRKVLLRFIAGCKWSAAIKVGKVAGAANVRQGRKVGPSVECFINCQLS
jgi:hypothetical protein